MRPTTARRWLAGSAAIGALIAATAAPAMALAPESHVELSMYMPDTTVAADTEGKIEYPSLYATEPVVLTGVTVTYDFTDLDGVATVSQEEGTGDYCQTPAEGTLVCTDPFEIGVDTWGSTGLVHAVIKAEDGAKTGASGKLKITLDANEVDSVSTTATVRVGAGVDLAAGTEAEFNLKPGAAFTAPLKLTNIGETDADGAVALFYNDYGIRSVKKYSNCTYEGDELRTCTFDDTFEAGNTYQASLPYTLGADTFAPSMEAGEVQWLTPAEYEDFAAYLKHHDVSVGTPGIGAALTLTSSRASRAALVQADKDPTNNWSTMMVNVTGKNGADLTAVGDTLTGKAGAVLTATVGLTNRGPATLDSNRSGDPVTRIDVTIPTGTTAVRVPEECAPLKKGQVDWEAERTGAAAYRCSSDMIIKVGETQTVELGLRIDKVVANATGTVKINTKCECSGLQEDLNPANDTAKLVVNPSSGGTGGGDSLPITGTATASLIAAGVLLLVAGAVGFVVTRRRRVRFTA